MVNKPTAKRSPQPKKKQVVSRQEFLDQISDILFTSFEDDQILKKIAQLIISNVADYCRIVTLDEENNISDISVNHTDHAKVQLITDLYDEYKNDFNATKGIHKILKTGQAELTPEIDKSVMETIKDSPKLVRIVKDIGLKSYMGIPLKARNKVVGAITFSSIQPDRTYNKDDLTFVTEVGRRIALALDNARLYREAQKARQQAEYEHRRLEDLFTKAPAMISMVQGPEHIYAFANPMYLKIVGKTEKIIGKSVAQVFPELKGQGILEILDGVYKTGKSYLGKEVLIKLDVKGTGKTKDLYFNFVYHPSHGNDGKVDGILTHAIEVTDQVKARQKIQLSEQHFRALIEHSADAIALTDKQGTIIYASPSVKKLLGYRADEMEGKPGSVFIHPDDLEMTRTELAGILHQTGKALTVEHRAIHKDGSIKWLETTATNLFEEPTVGAVVTNFRDITERKQAEQQLRESEERARAVFDQAAAAMSITTLDGKWISFNRMYPAMFGYSRAQLNKMTFTELTHPDDRAADKVNISLLIRGEIKEYTREKRYIHQNGSIVYVVIHVSAVRNEAGDPQYIIAVLQDITKRKQMEESIQNSEIRHRTMIEQSPLSTQIMSPEGKTVQVNKAWEDLWGLSLKQLKDYNILEDKQLVELGIMPYIKQGFAGKATFIPAGKYEPSKTIKDAKDLPYRWVQAFIYPVKNKKNIIREVVLIHQDITEQKKAEELLSESEERLRFMSESLPQKVFTADSTGSVDYFNPQWMEYTGLSFEQIRDWGWVQFIHPDDVDENVRRWQHSIDTGEPFELEHRFRRYDGAYRWHISRAQAMRDCNGKVIRWFGSNTDIDDMRRTTKRKNELESITASLTAQRAELVALNKAKDEFISLASHQLRTPATGVKQYLGMTLEGYAGELNNQQIAFLTQAYESNERQINIVNDLLQVAKIDAGKVALEKESIDLVSLVNDIIQEQSSTFKTKKQKVTFAPPSVTFEAVADRNRMRMVLENIIDNASKYTPENKRIDIILSKDKETIQIAIKDQGVGVDKSDIAKMFDKFSRIDNPLSVVVGGTGLGLYWAKKIIDLHGGSIEVKSKVDRGSIFTIHIPSVPSSDPQR